MSKLDNLGLIAKWLNFLAITIFILAAGVLIYLKEPPLTLPPAESPAPIPPPVITTLFFAGDIMLSRNVAGKIIENDNPGLPFAKVQTIVSSADISFANLESPFLDKPPYAQQGIVFKADPETIDGIKFAGFDILSTANNHSFDQGRDGVEFTINHLATNDIVPVGSGLDCPEGKIIEKNSIKFGFLAYSYTAYNEAVWKSDPLVCQWEKSQIQRDVARLKPQVDFLIVSFHAGTEYKRVPDETNVKLAQAAVDAGADMVIGHHPHWFQTIEQYQGKWIFYSLGNFVFDQMWSQDTREGLTLLVTFEDQELSKIELKPVIIDDYCCPRWANDEETKNILSKIDLTSDVLIDKN